MLASGRPTAGILPLAKALGLDKKGGCVLAYNGGKIVDCVTGEALYQVQLGAEFVPELCEFAARQDVAILTYNSEGIVCERDQDVWANKECFTTKLPMIHVDDLPPMWTIRSAKCSSLLTLPGGMLSAPPERSSLRAGSTCTPPAPSSSSRAAGRGKGQEPCRSAGADGPDPGEPDACGDGLNDRSMISYAGVGVAMQNAEDAVKAVADYVTAATTTTTAWPRPSKNLS